MLKTAQGRIIEQFPHCDPRVLHAPKECEFCDGHPEWQALREAWGIAFTGHTGEKTEDEHGNTLLPCPAELNRSFETINKWPGNTPETPEKKQAREAYYNNLLRNW